MEGGNILHESMQLSFNWYVGLVIARFVGKVRKLELGLETGVTGASPPTVTSMGGSFYLGGQVQGRRP
jgi:hypothetical protein